MHLLDKLGVPEMRDSQHRTAMMLVASYGLIAPALKIGEDFFEQVSVDERLGVRASG